MGDSNPFTQVKSAEHIAKKNMNTKGWFSLATESESDS